MKKLNKKNIFRFLLALYLSFSTCFAVSFLAHSNFIDLYWAKATEIRKIQMSSHVDYVSGYLKSPDDYPTFYNASYFYKLQYVSRYWNFDAPKSNNLFFKYTKKNTYSPLSFEKDYTTNNVDVFCNLYEDALRMFPIKLKFGNQIESKVNRTCCEYSYISEDLANAFDINIDNYKEKSIQLTASRIHSKERTTYKTISIKVAGVISSDSLGIYSSYVNNSFYIFTNWSDDLQTTMNCPDFNVMFYKDSMKNRYYISTIEKSISGKLLLLYEDKINSKTIGVNNERINSITSTLNVTRNHNLLVSLIVVAGIITSIVVLIILENKILKTGLWIYLTKNIYWMSALSMFVSFLIIKYIFPLILPAYIITLSEVGSTITISIIISILMFVLTFEETITKKLTKKS